MLSLSLALALVGLCVPQPSHAQAGGEMTLEQVEAAAAARRAAAAAAAAAPPPPPPPTLPTSVKPEAAKPAAAAAAGAASAAVSSAASSATPSSAPVFQPQLYLALGPSAPAQALAFLPGSPLLAMAAGNQVQLWDLARQLNLGSLQGHADTVAALAAAPGGGQLASVSRSGELRLWSTRTGDSGAPAATGVAQPNALAFSADGRLLAVGGAQTVALFDLASGRGLHLLPGGSSGQLQFSADGQMLAVRGAGVWRLWSVEQGQSIGSLAADAQGVPLALSPSLAQALRSDGRHVSLVNLADASVVARTASPGVTQAVFSSDGAHVAWVQADGRALRWQLQGGLPQMLAPAVADATGAPADAAPALAFSTDGALLAAAGHDQVLRLWDAQGRPQGRLTATGQPLHSLAMAGDGSALTLSLDDGQVWLLDTGSGQLQALRAVAQAAPAPPTPGRLLELSPDGRTLASAAGGQLRLFSRATGQPLVTLGSAQARDLRFSPDGAWLFVLEDQQLQVWDVALRYRLQTLALSSDLQQNRHLAFDVDGAALLLWADGGQPRRVQLEARAITNQGLGAAQRRAVPGLPATLAASRRWAGALSPDGRLLALDTGDGDTLVLERSSGRELLRLRNAAAPGSTLQFSADGGTLHAWGAAEGGHAVRRWALPDGQALPALQGHQATVLGLAGTTDGRWLASVAADRTLRLWRASDGQLRATLQLLDAPGWVAVDGQAGFEASSPEAEAPLRLRTGPGLGAVGALGAARAKHERPGVLKRAFSDLP